MTTTIDFMEALKARHSLASDYAIAKKLGITCSAVSKWRNQQDFLGDATSIKVAKLLDIDPAYVVACAHAERARSEDEKSIWQGIADMVRASDPQRFCIMLNRLHPRKLLYKLLRVPALFPAVQA